MRFAIVYIFAALAINQSLSTEVGPFEDVADTVAQCLRQEEKMDCMKRKIIKKLNEGLVSNEAIEISDMISIKKDPKVAVQTSENNGRSIDEAKGTSLDEMILNKINDYFKSMVIQFKLNQSPEEGRRRKHKLNNYFLYGAFGVGSILIQLFIGKLALVAGTALLISKISLMIAFIAGIKKLISGGNSEHVIYTDHGGWHRSGAVANELPYRGYVKNKNIEDIPSQIEYSYYPGVKNDLEIH